MKSAKAAKKNPKVSPAKARKLVNAFVQVSKNKGVKLASDGSFEHDVLRTRNSIVNVMNSKSIISQAGKAFIDASLNPCGEGNKTGVRCPDAAIPQSGVLSLRTFETIVPPWNNISEVGDTTKNWSMLMISPGCYAGIGLIVASKNAVQPTSEQVALISSRINDSGVPDYPAWSVGDSEHFLENFAWTYLRYKSADLDVDPQTQQSKNIEAFRVIGDGFVIHHNAPEIWNQGAVAVGQFQTDFNSAQGNPKTEPIEFHIDRSSLTVATISMYTNGESGRIYYAQDVIVNGLDVGTSFSTNAFPANTFPDKYSITFDDGQVWASDLSTHEPFTINIKYTPGNAIQLELSTSSSARPHLTRVLQGTEVVVGGLNMPANVFTNAELTDNILWDLPSTDMADVVQADPKFSAELLQEHKGVYIVRRFFQPVLTMNRSNVSGNIKLVTRGMSRQAIIDTAGGIQNELLDVNAGTVVTVLNGISYAMNPVIKGVRFLEFVPAAQSPLAPIVTDVPAQDVDALEVFRQVQSSGPHSYIPDANALGLLANFLHGVVSALPLVMRSARSIAQAVDRGAEWMQNQFG